MLPCFDGLLHPLRCLLLRSVKFEQELTYDYKGKDLTLYRNPWLILLIESFDGFCGFLGIIAGNFYCASAAPPGMLASMNGLLYAAIFGVGTVNKTVLSLCGKTSLISYLGRALGTSVGSSLIMGRSGTRFAYLVFGILSGSTSVFYFFLYHSLLKKIERKRLKAIKGIVQ